MQTDMFIHRFSALPFSIGRYISSGNRRGLISAMAYHSDALIAADEDCSAILLRRYIRTECITLVSQFLGLDRRDDKWIALAAGRYCTVLCNMNVLGGFENHFGR